MKHWAATMGFKIVSQPHNYFFKQNNIFLKWLTIRRGPTLRHIKVKLLVNKDPSSFFLFIQ